MTPATVTIEDDDARGVELSATALTMPEGESRTYTVVLSSQPAGPVTVTPLASGSPDVTLSPSALTFTAESWNAAQTVTVSAAQDADAEDDAATISHAVSGVDYASVTAGDVAVTVSDDDTRGVELSATALTVPEGESWTYTVMLSSQPSGPVTVTPALKAGSSSDVTVSGALTFTAADWDRAQTVTVSAAPDADAADDRATVSHAVSGGGYGSVTAADVAVTVADDETASTGVTLTVSDEAVDEDAGATAITVTGTLNGAPGTSDTAVTVSVSGGTASAGDFAAVQDFTLTIGAGQASGTASFTLTPVDDAIDEGDETVRVAGAAQGLEVTPATVTIEDDDARGVELSATALTMPEGESRTYTVVLSSQPAGPVTVTPLASGSPDVTLSPSALTFTAESWNAAQTVTVSAAQDADAEDDAATISHAVSGVDYASVTAGDVAVTVSDDDTRGVELSATALTVPEGESWTYTVMLSSQPSGPVTVTLSALKAGSSSDVTVSGALTFTAADWDRAQTVTVSAAPDADAADDRATVSHAVSGGGYGSVTAADVAVTVADDETASTGVTLTVSDEAVGEDAGATAITVTGTLNGAPGTSDTAVTVTVSGGTASAGDFAAVQDFTLTIGAGQASGTASFTLTPVDDAIDEGDETVRVAGAAQGLEVTPATVTIEDDDARGIAVSTRRR